MHQYAGFRLNYELDSERLDASVRERFVPMRPSEATFRFIDACRSSPPSTLRTSLHRALSSVLSDFDVNGLLGMYPMHLLSSAEFGRLLRERPSTLLDVGAGNGDVTAALAPLSTRLRVSEASWAMRRVLRRRGFEVVSEHLEALPNDHDVVACLNVLDRTRRPVTLLQRLVELLAPGGKLLLSVPLPLRPFHYVGGSTRAPEEHLPTTTGDYESALTALFRWLAGVLPEFEPRAFSRVPYLSGGDARRTMYALDAAVLVLARSPDHEPDRSVDVGAGAPRRNR